MEKAERQRRRVFRATGLFVVEDGEIVGELTEDEAAAITDPETQIVENYATARRSVLNWLQAEKERIAARIEHYKVQTPDEFRRNHDKSRFQTGGDDDLGGLM